MGTVKFGDFPSYTNEINFVADVEGLGVEAVVDHGENVVLVNAVGFAEFEEEVIGMASDNGGRQFDE